MSNERPEGGGRRRREKGEEDLGPEKSGVFSCSGADGSDEDIRSRSLSDSDSSRSGRFWRRRQREGDDGVVDSDNVDAPPKKVSTARRGGRGRPHTTGGGHGPLPLLPAPAALLEG